MISAKSAALAQYAVARDHEGEGISADGAADRPSRLRAPQICGDVGVCHVKTLQGLGTGN